MPYTPPSHRSPASSAPPSPDVSRRASFTSGTTSPRPSLPRSASYLTKHRRTPSAPQTFSVKAQPNGATPDMSPMGTSDDLKGMASVYSASVRQSPPPVADNQSMPPGAIISPPDSSSEDEGVAEEPEVRGRQIENMQELKEAISSIPQHRAGSPTRSSAGDLLLLPAQLTKLIEAPRPSMLAAGLPTLDTTTRKISHARSHTDSNILVSRASESSLSASEEGSDVDDPPKKPLMVRKKSGELVRPALRPAAHRRPSSMPGTPTFSKAVHFDSHLEHVRHFLQVDRPLAVSAGSSPADNYESDTEYPFGAEAKSGTRSPPYEWEMIVNSFPADTPLRKGLPVRLERVWMSPDHKSLIGSLAVANLAFQKTVVCRFTFDYWKTTSEVAAEFHHEIRPKETETGHDRFQFGIKLSDLASLESKTLYFCIRYNVNGHEYWDNNNGVNFQVDFRKKMLPQNGKRGMQGASSRPVNALPRSNRRTSPSTSPRPKSMPVGALDEFGHSSNLVNFDQPIHEFLGETGPAGLRLKSSKSTTSIPSDNLSSRLSAPSGVAFANRYDFGASLTAAMQAHKDSTQRGDGLYMKVHKKAAFSTSPPAEVGPSNGAVSSPKISTTPPAPEPSIPAGAPTIPGTDSPSSAAIASSSYEEILNKYCFFNGSKQSSPQMKEGTLRSGQHDGAADMGSYGTNSFNSSTNGSPIYTSGTHYGAMHHSLRANVRPYHQNGFVPAIGASPADSPLDTPPAVMRALSPATSNTPTARSSSPGSMAHYVPLTGTLLNDSINAQLPSHSITG
ncbi:putative phosphatase regulatory subunit-domain-containing protein [Xylariaceae sp. FL0016]|nr:putative phosphatase regulatory subunit-domain-containing protein [Xylariaceae sp. FL0016]